MIPAHSSGAASASSNTSGSGVGVALVDDGQLGVAAVGVPSGERRVDAEVLVAAPAEPAPAARVAQPGDADPLADVEPRRSRPASLDGADDLVAGHDPWPVRREVALGEVQVGAADAARETRTRISPRPGCGSARAPNRSGPPAIGPAARPTTPARPAPDPSVSCHPSAQRQAVDHVTLGWRKHSDGWASCCCACGGWPAPPSRPSPDRSALRVPSSQRT